ncbi:MAG TPA: energy transducer TonB [Thermoanaerobaculia bacterium]|nr:energy transducer TonB [Thermoanaerobaculia bacterium]
MRRTVTAFALISVMIGCSTAPRAVSGDELRVIEFGDHPDPHTGPSRTVETWQSWPLELTALTDAVAGVTGMHPVVYDMRRRSISIGTDEELDETTVRVLDLTPQGARISVVMDGAPPPLELTLPINRTVVIGSEVEDQRHAFVAISLFDPATAAHVAEVFSTREPEVRPPVKIQSSPLTPTASAIEHNLKGVIVEVDVDETGAVKAAHAFLGKYPSATDQIAIENSVRQWKFAPATRHGKPVRVITDVAAEFAR